MPEASIHYKKGYKYQAARNYMVQTAVVASKLIQSPWVDLSADGMLLIKKGFASDGPSGITIDTPSFMRGAFIHDAFYYLIRQGKLGMEWREVVDEELHRIIIEDGMWRFRAWYVLRAVQRFGRSSAEGKRQVFTAP